MPINDALQFLRRTPPFSGLAEPVLKEIAAAMQLEFYPKGRVLIRQDGPTSGHLGIIRDGGVRIFVTTNEGEEVFVDSRGSGDAVGLLSAFCGEMARHTIVATEDTSCYLIDAAAAISLALEHEDVAEFWYKRLLRRMADLTYREISERTLLYGGGDKMLFTSTLGDIAAKTVVTAPEDCSIQLAADLMTRHGISSLVLCDEDGLPVGMVTDRDLREKVVARGMPLTGPVKDIMSVALIKADARDYCFEALLKMLRYNIHHLLVVQGGTIQGVITNHDLMLLQGTSPLTIAREIESRDTVEAIAPVSRRINRVVTLLIKEGARAQNITRIITEINDRLLKKVLEITEQKLGPPPVRYCWIVYGSEGRKEQTFRTDQDNAIIYEDSEEHNGEAERYFADFSVRMQTALAECGFPPCPAGYMASTPRWRKPLTAWKRYFTSWIDQPTPEAVLSSLIFFDFRPVYGDHLLAETLRAFLGHAAKKGSLFLSQMAAVVLKNRPAAGVFGGFRTERRGEAKGTLNIKEKGICPIVDLARLAALESGIYETSTLARLNAIKERRGSVSSFCDDLSQVFEFLTGLRLRHQLERMEAGALPDNLVRPDRLGVFERKTLKEAFRVIIQAQEAAARQYGSMMIR